MLTDTTDLNWLAHQLRLLNERFFSSLRPEKSYSPRAKNLHSSGAGRREGAFSAHRKETVERVIQLRAVNGAALATFVYEYAEIYAQLCETINQFEKIPWDIQHLDFRNLNISGSFKIEAASLPGNFFGLYLDFTGSKIEYLGMDLRNWTGSIAIDVSECLIDQLIINRGFVDGVRAAIGSVVIDDKGSVSLKDCEINEILCRDVEDLALTLEGTKIKESMRFQHVRMYGELNLHRAQIGSKAVFQACFFLVPPRVHAALFPSDTSFPGCQFGPRANLFVRKAGVQTIDRAENYRVLKMAMKSAGATFEEGRFFALEMRSRRLAKEYVSGRVTYRMPRTDEVFSLLYDLVSSYGTSIGRALLAFAMWNIIFLLAFCVVMYYGPTPVWPPKEVFHILKDYPAVGYTLQNILNPAAAISKSSLLPVPSILVLCLSIAQGLGSLGIVALLLLAVRSKFQRGS